MLYRSIINSIMKPKPAYKYVESGSFVIVLGTALWGSYIAVSRLFKDPDVALTRANPFPWQQVRPHESTRILKTFQQELPKDTPFEDESMRYHYKRKDTAMHHPVLDKIAHE